MYWIKRMINHFKEGLSLLECDIKMIKLIDIASCGVNSDDDPYIRLRSGEIFYSYYPTKRECVLFHNNKRQLPVNLKECSFRVALDIIQRFYRENSAYHLPPKSHHLYPGWGFIDLGAHIGFMP